MTPTDYLVVVILAVFVAASTVLAVALCRIAADADRRHEDEQARRSIDTHEAWRHALSAEERRNALHDTRRGRAMHPSHHRSTR